MDRRWIFYNQKSIETKKLLNNIKRFLKKIRYIYIYTYKYSPSDILITQLLSCCNYVSVQVFKRPIWNNGTGYYQQNLMNFKMTPKQSVWLPYSDLHTILLLFCFICTSQFSKSFQYSAFKNINWILINQTHSNFPTFNEKFIFHVKHLPSVNTGVDE